MDELSHSPVPELLSEINNTVLRYSKWRRLYRLPLDFRRSSSWRRRRHHTLVVVVSRQVDDRLPAIRVTKFGFKVS